VILNDQIWVGVGGELTENDITCVRRYSCHILMKFEFSERFFEKYSNTKFNDNQFSCSAVVVWGRTDGRTDTKYLIIAFRNFSKEPKNVNHQHRAAVVTVCVPQTGFDSTVKHTDRALENVSKCKNEIYKS
jgi:hypothetical protein